MKQSSGTLLYRQGANGLEVLLVHPSGVYNRRSPWGIPKGMIDGEETPPFATSWGQKNKEEREGNKERHDEHDRKCDERKNAEHCAGKKCCEEQCN